MDEVITITSENIIDVMDSIDMDALPAEGGLGASKGVEIRGNEAVFTFDNQNCAKAFVIGLLAFVTNAGPDLEETADGLSD